MLNFPLSPQVLFLTMFKAAESSGFRNPLAKLKRCAAWNAESGSQVHVVRAFGHPDPPVENTGWGGYCVQHMDVKVGLVWWRNVAVEKPQSAMMRDDWDSQCSEACPTESGPQVEGQRCVHQTVLKYEHLDSEALARNVKSGLDQAFETPSTNKAGSSLQSRVSILAILYECQECPLVVDRELHH